MAEKSYTFSFKVDPATFRRALYFNTFFKQRIQLGIVAAMWLLGLGILVANLAFRVEMTTVTQMCAIVMFATIPLLIFSCEHGYRQYRDSDRCDKKRVVSISESWLKFRVGGCPDSEKVEWRQIAYVFELDDMFIIYRDANLMVLLPKAVMTQDELSAVRKMMLLKLGRAYRIRRGFLAGGRRAQLESVHPAAR